MNLTKVMVPLIALAAVVGSAFLFKGCHFEPYQALVIEKVYTPSSTSTGVGYGMTSNGKSGMVVTTNSEPEKYTLIVQRMDDYQTVSVSVDAATWARAEKGQQITLQRLTF